MFGVGRGSVSLPFVMIYGLEVKEVKRFLRRAFAYCAHRESAPKEIVHKLARCMGMKKWQEENIVRRDELVRAGGAERVKKGA